MNKPEKPKLSKGMIIYSIIVTIIFVCLLLSDMRHNVEGVASFVIFYLPPIWYFAYFFRKLNDYHFAQKNYPEYLNREIKKLEKQIAIKEAEEETINAELQMAIQSQNATEPWAVRYMTSPCPYCGHYKVRYAKWDDKSLSVAFWGIASSKIDTNYKCDHCKHMW